jgi:hypothetical protein
MAAITALSINPVMATPSDQRLLVITYVCGYEVQFIFQIDLEPG